MRIYDIIAKKRDGKELTKQEIDFFIEGYTNGTIKDYQASALLMAIFINGMNPIETANLTYAMAKSGDMIDLSPISGVKVDKHSTGGVGDKTTLVLGPIVASCGVPVAKMSGRGLGHTGGTIDKLESIPGLNTSLDIKAFIDNVKNIGIAVAGQTGNLAPADKKLYALRDVTATVNNISLIASSIMSKKLASGADAIVLDVKTGGGAFMKTLDDSINLAKAMVEIGENTNRKTVAFVTEMDIPLGKAIGNSIEVIEAIETLKGKGPEDLTTVSITLAAKMLELAGKGSNDTCLKLAQDAISSGRALEKFREMIKYQNGNENIIDDYTLFGNANYKEKVLSSYDGYVNSMNTEEIGKAGVVLGAGRETKESSIDMTAGIVLNKKPGDKVSKGEELATIYTNNSKVIKEVSTKISECYTISSDKVDKAPLILAYVDSKDIIKYI